MISALGITQGFNNENLKTFNFSAVSALPKTAVSFPSGEMLPDDKGFPNSPKKPGGSPVHSYLEKKVQFYQIVSLLSKQETTGLLNFVTGFKCM